MEHDKRVDDAKHDFVVPLRTARAVVGYCDHIHGRGGEAVPAFVPSRHELLELFKYWRREDLECETEWRFLHQTCSMGMRIEAFANLRMKRIAEALDDPAAIEAAAKEAYEAFLAKYHLTAEQWESGEYLGEPEVSRPAPERHPDGMLPE